jgi:hypothetical protein
MGLFSFADPVKHIGRESPKFTSFLIDGGQSLSHFHANFVAREPFDGMREPVSVIPFLGTYPRELPFWRLAGVVRNSGCLHGAQSKVNVFA